MRLHFRGKLKAEAQRKADEEEAQRKAKEEEGRKTAEELQKAVETAYQLINCREMPIRQVEKLREQQRRLNGNQRSLPRKPRKSGRLRRLRKRPNWRDPISRPNSVR